MLIMAQSLKKEIIPLPTVWEKVSEFGHDEKCFYDKMLLNITGNFFSRLCIEKLKYLQSISVQPDVLEKRKQQNLPVTIKYPEMVAELFLYATHDKLPDHGKESLWFL